MAYPHRCTLRRPWLAPLAFASLALGGASWAQEPTVGPRPEPAPAGQNLFEDMDPDAARQEMIRLFHEVERTLEAIDVELADAGAGEVPLADGKESGIDRLLRASGAKGQEAVDGIDRILQLAQEMSGQSGGT